MNAKAKKIWNIVTTIIIIALVILAVMLSGIRIFGLTPYCVLSGSMEPTYKTGSMIYVKEVSATDVKKNDPITFYMDDGKTVATHRAIRIDSENQLFYTKGDANNVEDPNPVSYSRFIGKPVFTVPYLGYLSSFISSSAGKFVLLAVIGVVILLAFVLEVCSRGNKGKKAEDVEEIETAEKAEEEKTEK